MNPTLLVVHCLSLLSYTTPCGQMHIQHTYNSQSQTTMTLFKQKYTYATRQEESESDNDPSSSPPFIMHYDGQGSRNMKEKQSANET